MALPNGLPQVSDLGQLLSTLGSNIVNLPKMQATSAPGTPAAGYFHSTVINRAEMPDLRKDLSVNLGINRIHLQQLIQLNDEIGPNGMLIYKAANDLLDRIRVVGLSDFQNTSAGQYIRVATQGNLTTGYIEITYYGTGLNLLITQPGAAHTAVYSINGGTEVSVNIPNMSTVISNRGYSANCVIPVISNQTLGLYTIKIRNTGAASLHLHGFEILNESADIKVNEGSIWNSGQSLYNPSQRSIAYSTDFESGIPNGRGGRVVVYQKPNGSVAKAINPVDATRQVLSLTDHSNEEVARTYFIREFGAGRADDFSSLEATASDRAFTLDDGTTTLVGKNVRMVPFSGVDAGLDISGTSNYIILTFVGTGLDLVWAKDGGSGTCTMYIDGGGAGQIIGTSLQPSATLTYETLKVASGLPYGTHTLRIENTNDTNNIIFSKFIVYQPKKPTIPSGAAEIADYNLMANFDGTTATNSGFAAFNDQMPVGVLAKIPTREFVYVGANWTMSLDVNALSGQLTTTGTNNSQPISYTFYGTGVSLLMASGGATYDFSVTIDGALNASGVARAAATNLGGGSYSATNLSGTQTPIRVEFTGLTLGEHTITIQRTAGGGNFRIQALHIITPIHSYKFNGPLVIQNSLSIGSQGINDGRVLASNINKNNIAQSIGITSSPTTNIVAFIPVPELSVTHRNTTGKIKVYYSLDAFGTANSVGLFRVYVNGASATDSRTYTAGTVGGSNDTRVISDSIVLSVPTGQNKIEVMWYAITGTITAGFTRRTLLVEEVD